jgi:prepilin-type processing-associated H-X9-DG protein
VLAVTAQNAGDDGIWQTEDDLVTPLNKLKADISLDESFGEDDVLNNLDRVRGFFSYHRGGGGNFVFGDGSVRFIQQDVDRWTYVSLSTIDEGEVIESP